MVQRKKITIDGNEAAAHIAYRVNEVIAIYPITPSSTMGEWCDEWSAEGKKNIWGTVPSVTEMQSEGGAAGAIHGSLQAGALSCTFTASQGLLLMIPNMYKIAGELIPTVFHVSARALATHALSIFGDHSDVMSTRSTGFALMSSNSVQEVMDLALISQASSLESRIPFLHFFDGFRTSHEEAKIEELSDEDIKAMIDDKLVLEYRKRAMTPDRPVLRGTAQNPDVFFQAKEAANEYYKACPDIVEKTMEKFEKLVGRSYKLFDYCGDPNAENIIIMMGSGAETAQEAVDYLNAKGEKYGLIKVRLYRPFSPKHLLKALPKSVKKIAVLDRTKEPGANGDPLYLDVVSVLSEAFNNGELSSLPKIIGGRYGLSSKEFTPAMVKAIYDELKKDKPLRRFVVGIKDDVSNNSLEYDPHFSTEDEKTIRAMFYGLGSDGTVGANKNSIKIIGEDTDNYAQGYFVYDSKKSGSITTSHLRFGPKPIHSSYLITKANFIGCHQWVFLEKYNILNHATEGSTFLLNSIYNKDEVWDKLPRVVQEEIIKKKIKFYVINAYDVAHKTDMGDRINTVMQTCFFAISGILPREEAIEAIKRSIKKTYGKKGDAVVKKNYEAVDHTLANLFEVKVPEKSTGKIEMPPAVSEKAPKFIKEVLGAIIAGNGDDLPVSKMPIDGTFPTASAQWEKRNIALHIPIWDSTICIQCNKCVLACPHAAIRAKAYEPKYLEKAPKTFKAVDYKGSEYKGFKYTIQVAPEDCTGCALCVEFCPAKDKKDEKHKSINMGDQPPIRESERENFEFFLSIPDVDRKTVKIDTVKGSQFLLPLFEYSGACSGCGETPYVKLVSQLFGDRTLIGNATGCSSIYGGNLPTTPWTTDAEGRGPTWANSLFEDNAEFGFGMRLAIDKQKEMACELLKELSSAIGDKLVKELINAKQKDEKSIYEQRKRVEELKKKLETNKDPKAINLLSIADYLVKKSVWIMGGDGWAYDIGYGGLDHVLASNRDVNILVLDTEVYSNTGGQMSKSTPRGAVAKFAAGGKPTSKKDLAALAVMYGSVYVAKVAMGYNDLQTIKAFIEAEAYEGPSIIIAYSHCINHGGFDMKNGMVHQKMAVESGSFPLFRYNPTAPAGEPAFKLDSKAPSIKLEEFVYAETRYKTLTKSKPENAKMLLELGEKDVKTKWLLYETLAKVNQI